MTVAIATATMLPQLLFPITTIDTLMPASAPALHEGTILYAEDQTADAPALALALALASDNKPL